MLQCPAFHRIAHVRARRPGHRPGGAQQVGGPFGDHHRGRMGVAPGDGRHHRGVRDAQARHTAHPQPGVGHRVVTGAHPAGAHRVVQRLRDGAHRLRGGLVVLLAGPRLQRPGDVRGQRPRPVQPLGEADTGQQPPQIRLGRQIAGVDDRRRVRIRPAQRDSAAALRSQQDDPDGDAVLGRRLQTVPDERGRREDQLQVRRGGLAGAVQERDGLADVGGQRAAPGQQTARDVGGGVGAGEGAGQRGAHQDRYGQVVLEVAAHGGQLGHRLDPGVPQPVGVADAGAQQQVRRADRARAQDDLTAGPQHAAGQLDPVRPAVLEQDAADLLSRDDPQVGAAQCRAQVAVGRAPPASAPLVERGGGAAAPVRLVEFGEPWQARLLAGVEEGVGQGVEAAGRGDPQRARGAVRRPAGRPGPALGAPEVAGHLGPGPLLARRPGPAVVVGGVPAHPHHRVERRGAAQGPATWPVQLPSAQARLGGRGEVPVVRGAEELGERRRDADLLPAVRPPGLHQRHPYRRALGQPGREHTARRSGADDDVVVHLAVPHRSDHPSRPSRSPDVPSRAPTCR